MERIYSRCDIVDIIIFIYFYRTYLMIIVIIIPAWRGKG